MADWSFPICAVSPSVVPGVLCDGPVTSTSFYFQACIAALRAQFPGSLRVRKLMGMKYEAQDK